MILSPCWLQQWQNKSEWKEMNFVKRSTLDKAWPIWFKSHGCKSPNISCFYGFSWWKKIFKYRNYCWLSDWHVVWLSTKTSCFPFIKALAEFFQSSNKLIKQNFKAGINRINLCYSYRADTLFQISWI